MIFITDEAKKKLDDLAFFSKNRKKEECGFLLGRRDAIIRVIPSFNFSNDKDEFLCPTFFAKMISLFYGLEWIGTYHSHKTQCKMTASDFLYARKPINLILFGEKLYFYRIISNKFGIKVIKEKIRIIR